MTIDRHHAIFSWNDDFKKNPLPAPLERLTEKMGRVNGVQTTLIRPFIKAILYYTNDLIKLEKDQTPDYLSLGYGNGTTSAEKCFVELNDPENDSDITVIVVYDPGSGKILGSLYKASTNRLSQYTVKGAANAAPDGTAVWLAMLTDLINKDNIYSLCIERMRKFLCGDTSQDDLVSEELLPACKAVYESLVKNIGSEVKLNLTSNTLPQITKFSLDSRKIGPALGKVEFGDFKVFPVLDGNGIGTVNTVNVDLSKYKLSFTKENLTPEESLMIPKIPDDNVTPAEAIEILDEMTETWSNPPATKITQILLEGGAGSGKSYLARLIAAILKRPFISFTCTPNTDEADIKGALLPIASDSDLLDMSDEDRKILGVIYDSTSDELYDRMAQAMGLPDMTECFLAPDSAYAVLSGVYDASCDSQKAYSLLCNTIMSKVKELMQKVETSNKGSAGSVQYKYIPSTIVRAIQNGWLLELQEPSCMLQQGMLSCLFDVLDKESIGALNTVCGTIYRHPDFMVIATTNRKYKGTKPLNEAARSRFQYFCKMDTPSLEVIMQRVAKKVGLMDMELVHDIADIFKKLEGCALEINASGAATLRGLYAFADAIKRKKDITFALERYLLYSITTDEDEIDELKASLEDCHLLNT